MAHLADMSIAALALTYFGKAKAVTATALVWPESEGDPNAVNPKSKATGLWQVLPSNAPGVDLTDPENNAREAAKVEKAIGFRRGWTTYRSGAYRLYLPRAQAAVNANLKGNPNGPWIAGDISKQQTEAGKLIESGAPSWLQPILTPLSAIGNAFQFLTDPANWLRLATFVAGGFLILLGVLFLIGSSKPVQKAASLVPAGRVVKTARRITA